MTLRSTFVFKSVEHNFLFPFCIYYISLQTLNLSNVSIQINVLQKLWFVLIQNSGFDLRQIGKHCTKVSFLLKTNLSNKRLKQNTSAYSFTLTAVFA